MGVYDCFLGSARTNGNILFLQKPEFIYFGFWIILIMLGLVHRVMVSLLTLISSSGTAF